MTAEIKALRPGGKLSNADLVELGSSPDLAKFMIVCFWDDGQSTIGWTNQIKNGELVYGSELLKAEVTDRVFPHRHGSDDIDY